MRVVVAGKSGQVASALGKLDGVLGASVVRLGRPDLDLRQTGRVYDVLDGAGPDIIVNAAAYTAVDRAESEASSAFAINTVGAGVIASAAAKIGVPVVHLSTDYVFDGSGRRPYVETDQVRPLGVYGQSKAESEVVVRDAHADHAILRTAWIYSATGHNFLRTMLRLAKEDGVVRVVDDQRGTPTSAYDIAAGVLRVCRNLTADKDGRLRGTFHMTAAGEATRADFADRIFADSRRLGGPVAEVERVTIADYPTVASRPANSVLKCDLIRTAHGISLPAWHDSVASVVEACLQADCVSTDRSVSL